MDRLLDGLAPLVAFLAGALAVCCVVTVPDVVGSWSELSRLERAPMAWCALAGGAAVLAAQVSLLVGGLVGPGLPLAVGAVSAVAGLVLGHDIDAAGRLVPAFVCLGVGAGSLLAAGTGLVDDVGGRTRAATLVGWGLPWMCGWALVCWLSLRDSRPDTPSLGARPPAWLLSTVAAAVLAWSVAALVLRTPSYRNPAGAGWENAWAALDIVVATSLCLAMLIAVVFGTPNTWARPVVLLTAGATVAALLGGARPLPVPELRPAYLALCVAGLVGPPCIQVLYLVGRQPSSSAAGWGAAAAGLVAIVAGWRGWCRPFRALSGGLVLVAAATAAGWVLPSDPWPASAVAAALSAGIAATMGAAFRIADRERMATRYLVSGGLAALVIGLLSAAPVCWALGGALTRSGAAARPGGRILFGVAFALTALAASAVEVLLRRVLRRRDERPSAGDLASSAGRHP